MIKKFIIFILLLVISFRYTNIIAFSEESANLIKCKIPIISNSQFETYEMTEIEAYINEETLKNQAEIYITIKDFTALTQMNEIFNDDINIIWNKGYTYFVLDKEKSNINAYYIISTETISDISKINEIKSRDKKTFSCKFIDNCYYIDMQSAFCYLHIDYDCNFEMNSKKYVAINCIDTLDILQKEYLNNKDLYKYDYFIDKNEINKSKGIKIFDNNGLNIVGLLYDMEKVRQNMSVDEYYKYLNIGLVEEGLEYLDYKSQSFEYVVYSKKNATKAGMVHSSVEKSIENIVNNVKGIDTKTLKSVGTIQSIIGGLGNLLDVIGLAYDMIENEEEKKQEKYVVEMIFNDIKKSQYTQNYFSLLSNTILSEYQNYALIDKVDINNTKEFAEYMKNHRYSTRSGLRNNDADNIRNAAILLYNDFYLYIDGKEYAEHIDINNIINQYITVIDNGLSIVFPKYGVVKSCYDFFVENNKENFSWWKSLTNYSESIVASYNFYNLRNSFLNLNNSNLISKDNLIGFQKMEIMMLKCLLKASESNESFISNSEKENIEKALKASSDLLFRLENCIDISNNYISIINNFNSVNKLKLQSCSWLLDIKYNKEEQSTTTEPKFELPEIVQAVIDNEATWLNDMNEMTYGYEGHMPKVGYNECWFQDIDMDGTPEFIVGGMGFQSDGIVIQVYNIYKYKNGSLQRIEVNGRTFSGEKEPYLELLWDGEEPYYGSGAFNNLLKVFKNNNTGEFLYTMEHKYDYTSDSDGGGVISFYVYNMNKDVFECDDNHIVYCSVDKNNIINGNYRVYNHDGEVDEQEFLKTYNSFFENLTPYETTIKSIPCTKLSAEKSGYYDTMSAEQKKQALLSSYNAWSCKENPDAELPLSKFIDKLNSQNNNHFNISDYEGVFYPTSYDDCPTAITINVQSETSANVLVEITNKNYTRYGRSEFSGNINSNPFTFEENDGFNNNCKFTLEFKDGKIYLTTKHIQLDSNAGWAIPELDKIELTKGNSENPPVSDYDILSAVNKYLRENQSQLGVWLSDSNPYCLPEHISSNKTNWSCPINLSWESYSSNEIAGSYPHFAYVDKSSLKCTLTANYETVVEFDLNDYIK